MNIVKIIKSLYFSNNIYALPKGYIYQWGLGDDGILYMRYYLDEDIYGPWMDYYRSNKIIPLSEMCLLVKEFSSLLAFL